MGDTAAEFPVCAFASFKFYSGHTVAQESVDPANPAVRDIEFQKFVKEANIDLDDPANRDLKIDFNEELMDQRMQVRKYILSGKIKSAINLINEINPYVSVLSL